jgi:predicted nucleic acid-binding protein
VTLKFAWDASSLAHAVRIDRLDVLGDLARGPADSPWSHYTTAAVMEELARFGQAEAEWLEVVHVDGIGELGALARWMGRVATPTHSKGEATVLAWAECHGAIAIVDDRDARRVAQKYNQNVHGLLWIVAYAVRDGRWNISSAGAFVDQLLASGARYPFDSGGFERWARKSGLIS